MVETKTLSAALIGTIVLLMGSLGVNVDQWQDKGYQPYQCMDNSQPDMLCHKLSKVNAAGVQSYCYFNLDAPTKYKPCSGGWKLIEQPVLIDEPVLVEESTSCPSVYGYAVTPDEEYLCTDCNENGCGNCIPKSSISLPGVLG